MSKRPGLEFAGTERFEIRRRLGAGAVGVVYEAFDREREAAVALKTLRDLNPRALYRLKNEFRALQDLEHPNLVSLGELVEERGTWFFTMELVKGDDFLTYVRGQAVADGERGTLDVQKLRAALSQLAPAVAALHDLGMVHHDIKPSNVLVTRDGRAVLMDSGMIHEVDVEQSTEMEVLANAAYMSPEQAALRSVGPQSDWYSVGVLLYQALTGRLPFEGSDFEIFMDKQDREPRPPSAIEPAVPADLDALCGELLRREPSARPTGRVILQRLAVEQPAQAVAPPKRAPRAPFVGRQSELELLWKALEDTRKEHAVTVVVHGESGLGKTALISEFTGALASQTIGPGADAVILRGRCHERESVPYKAFDGIIDELSRYLRGLPRHIASALLPRNTALLARVFPVLGRVRVVGEMPESRYDTSEPQELRNRMFASLREMLGKLTERWLVILTIDDLQWADRDSLLLLGDLMRPPDAPPLLLLISSRPGSAVTPGADGERDEGSPLTGDVRYVALGALGRAPACELAQLLLARDGIDTKTVHAEALAVEARGHPMYIHELVRHAATAGASDHLLRLEEAIAARVAQLEPPARKTLELVCVAGGPLPQELVAEAAEIELAALARPLAQLRTANLVRTGGTRATDPVEPYHDRVREAVVGSLEEAVRTGHHSRLASALESAGGDPELLLRHLEAAGQTERAAQSAVGAGDRARAALALDRAAELYRTALRLGSWDDDALREVRLKLAEALADAGQGPEAAPVFIEAAEGAERDVRLECYRRAAEQWLITGHIERGFEALDRLLAETGMRLPATPRRALISLLRYRMVLRLRGLRWKERAEAEIGAEKLIRVDVCKTVGHGLSVVDNIRGADFQARGLLLALRAGERTRVGRSLAVEAIFLATQGGRGRARARRLISELERISEMQPNPYMAGWLLFAKGAVRYFGGQFPAAAEALSEAHSLFREKTTGTTFEQNNVTLFLEYALREQGALVPLQALFDESVRSAARRGDRFLETSVRLVGSLLWLVRDDPEGARGNLSRATWMAPEGVFHLQHYYDLRTRGELALYEGRARAALTELQPLFDAMARSMLSRIQIVRVLWRWVHARLLVAAAAAAEDGDPRACALAARLARRLERERIGYATVLADLVRAGLAEVSGARDRALEHLDAAIVAAEQHDMRLHVAAATRRKGQLLGAEGSELVASADKWMAGEGVVHPGRMTEVYAPGFVKSS